MKKFIFIVLVALLNSCKIETPCGCVAPPNAKLIGISAKFAAQNSTFAFDYFRKVNEKEVNNNVILSPLSLDIALGMLLNGANSKTADEIKTALRKEGFSTDELNQTYQKLMQGLPKVDNSVTVNIANSVWLNDQYTLETNFTDNLKNFFLAQTYPFSMLKKDEAKTNINQWASDKTQGKVPTIIDDVPNDAFLFLLNAVYFKGNWKYQFNASETKDSPFYLTSEKTKTVKLMKQTNLYRVTQGNNYAAFELPYANGDFNMTIILPDRTEAIDKFIQTFDYATWKTLQSNLKEQKEEIAIPKFELSYDADLNETLKALGMKTAFTNQADLSKITTKVGLYVSKVKQKVYIKADEVGTEAAGVTSIGIGLTSVPLRNYICDRPFILVISEKSSDTILFTGKIANP